MCETAPEQFQKPKMFMGEWENYELGFNYHLQASSLKAKHMGFSR